MGRTIAKVAVSRAIYSIDKPYDYGVPAELEHQLRPGIRVLVPFGAGNRGAEGIVLSISDETETIPNLKYVQALLDDSPVLDAQAIQLALWMRERYFCTLYRRTGR